MTVPSRRKVWLYSLAAVAPLPLLVASAWLYADHLGERLGSRLIGWANASASGPPPATIAPDFDGGAVTGDLVEPIPVVPVASETGVPIEPAVRRRPIGRRQATEIGGGATRVPTKGIRVSAATVLRIANSGVRPVGIPVPAEGSRPAGLMLSGVSGLGVGIQDGDVLTHAGGRPALSESDVVGLVIAARGKEVPVIGGQFWRNGETWSLAVEQPYVREDGRPLHRKRSTPDDEHETGAVAVARQRGERGVPASSVGRSDPRFKQ